MATTVGPTVSELLRNSRFEILPLDGIEAQVREHLPTGCVDGTRPRT